MRKIAFLLVFLVGIFNISFAVEDVLAEVVDIKFAKKVKNKQPAGVSEVFPNDIKKVYCWTRIRAFKVPTYVIHEWYYKDMKMASVKLNITYPLFRTWSSKKIVPRWVGDWKVIVKDENGNIIAIKSFLIQEK